MDAFFASVEQRDHPALRGKPIAVGHAGARGVVATASYEARKFGVHSAMPSAKARELCPELIFVHSRMKHYQAVSKQVREIFERYTDVIEPVSIDEAYLDVTENKINAPLAIDIAKRIKKDIREELGLVASAGVSYNKFLAKIASDHRKPDGLCVIHPDQAIEFIDTLPIEAFWGIGPATAKRLVYYNFVRGIDDRPVVTHRERKSVGCEETFGKDIKGPLIDQALQEVITELVRRLKNRNFTGKRLTLKVRFPDFTTLTRSVTSNTVLDNEAVITPLAQKLFQSVELPASGIRLLGLSVSKTEQELREREFSEQMTLFS